jgi:hypothetical protein
MHVSLSLSISVWMQQAAAEQLSAQADNVTVALRHVHATLAAGAPDAAARAALLDPLNELQRHSKGPSLSAVTKPMKWESVLCALELRKGAWLGGCMGGQVDGWAGVWVGRSMGGHRV